MELKFKIWMTRNDELVFGRGRAALLDAIESEGSISAAAKRLGISYRHAWTMLSASEKRLGARLVERRRGGATGGGARLTAEARAVLRKFRSADGRFAQLAREMEREIQGIVD